MKQKVYLVLTYVCVLFVNVSSFHVANASIFSDAEKDLIGKTLSDYNQAIKLSSEHRNNEDLTYRGEL